MFAAPFGSLSANSDVTGGSQSGRNRGLFQWRRGTGWCIVKAWGVLSLLCAGVIGMGVQSPTTLARSTGFEGIPGSLTSSLCEHGQLLPPCRVSYVLLLMEEIEHVGFPYQVTVADTHFLFLA